MDSVSLVMMECYEETLREITRKICGEEGLEGVTVEYADSSLPSVQANSNNNVEAKDDHWVASEEELPWTKSKIASYNHSQKLFRCDECESVGFLSRVAEHWLGTHANLRVFQCSQCSYTSAWARCVRMHLAQQHNIIAEQHLNQIGSLWKENPVLGEVTTFLQRLKNKVESEYASTLQIKIEEMDPEYASTQPKTEKIDPDYVSTLQAKSEKIGLDSSPTLQLKNEKLELEFTSTLQTKTNEIDLGYGSALQSKRGKLEYVSSLQTKSGKLDLEYAPTLQTKSGKLDLEYASTLQTKSGKLDLEYASTTSTRSKKLGVSVSESTSPDQPVLATNSLSKRYNCRYCPYATDRRDLYTRHENIHRDEKPFQCYVCLKQFNRADHVKKHFVRIHREVAYDINRIKRDMKEVSVKVQIASKPKPMISNVEKTKLNVSSCQKASYSLERSKKLKIVEKKYKCGYCSWTSTDNWCLKRHLNTHLKPYSCSLCEYKAARSERLTTHIYKVHNSKLCDTCSYTSNDESQDTFQLEQNK